jgi:hypothetical protein
MRFLVGGGAGVLGTADMSSKEVLCEPLEVVGVIYVNWTCLRLVCSRNVDLNSCFL